MGVARSRLGLFLLFGLLVKIPAFNFPHQEMDERIYWELAEKMTRGQEYNLYGTGLLPQLSSYMYDRPLFHHPPLFPALLTPFVALQAPRAAVVALSWMGHLLAIVAVALLVADLDGASERGLDDASGLWLVLLGVTVDPVLMFVSRKLWIDSLLTGVSTLALAFYVRAGLRGSRRLLLLGSALLGAAALMKVSTLVLLPVAVYAVLAQPGRRVRVREVVGWGVLPTAALVTPWFVSFYLTYGVLLPTWAIPDAWLIKHNALMRTAIEQPAYFYLKRLALLEPLGLLCVAEYVRRGRDVLDRTALLPIIWFGTTLAAFTALGAGGYGFQMRHLAPAVPAFYVALSRLTSVQPRSSAFALVALLAIVYAAMSGAYYLAAPQYDEILSFVELVKLVP